MDVVFKIGVISSFLQISLDKLFTFAHNEISSIIHFDGGLRKLERTALKIQDLLDYAEERSVISKSWKVWHRDLTKASYDADDLLDEISWELSTSHGKSNLDESTHTNENQVPSIFTSPNFVFSMSDRISTINKKLEDIVREMNNPFMAEMVKSRQSKVMRRPYCCTTTSLIDASSVIGRNKDREEITGKLLSAKRVDLMVIPIVGMGGIGKSTLAQIIYNDASIAQHFDLRIWVHVSVEFDMIKITRSILESITKKNCKISDLDVMQVRLQHVLSNKKFLLVFDDMWNENFSDWDLLRSPFSVGSIGSTILVTTRSTIVASIVGTTEAHHLQGLSDDDCWTLIRQRAFENRVVLNEHQNFNGEEIARKCKGSPLAAKTLGSILRFKFDKEEWDAILKGELRNLPEDKNEIFPALRLSYDHLAAHLKKCFAYCSIFPQTFEFKKDYLVQLWMAEGFIQSEGRRRMEEIGNDYFDNLLWRSFFQESRVSEQDPAIYQMHNLIHDLAQLVSADICFQMEDDMPHSFPISSYARHLSFLCENIQRMNLEAFYKFENLRTLLLLKHRTHIKEIPSDLFLKLIRLRVLDLSDTCIVELPHTIGNLKHLRYLNVSGTCIEKLPESTGKLCGLQTLMLKDCQKFLQLPKQMSKLTDLRHLDLDISRQLSSMPPDFGKLIRLQTLYAFIVGNDGGCRIRELKNMRDLRGSISITNLQNVGSLMEAKEAMLDQKPNLDKIELQWTSYSRDGGTVAEDVLAGLKPHENVQELHIKGYIGFQFPPWLGDPSLCKLKSLYLQGCACQLLPPLGGLPLLKSLQMANISNLISLEQLFSGGRVGENYPSLEFLEICDFPQLEVWDGSNANEMPHLRQLKIASCPNLTTLRSLHNLHSLERLEISRCPILPSLPAGLPNSLQALIISESPILHARCRVGAEDWEVIRRILMLEIDLVQIPMQGRGN